MSVASAPRLLSREELAVCNKSWLDCFATDFPYYLVVSGSYSYVVEPRCASSGDEDE